MTDPTSLNAVDVTELYADMLNYLQRDAHRLVEAAFAHSGGLPLAPTYFEALELSARAKALAEKIDEMIAEMSPRLATVVAVERERTGARIN